MDPSPRSRDPGPALRIVAVAWALTGASPLTAQSPSLDVGFRHACVLDASGQLRCWGSNGSGELGDGTDTLRAAPVPVAGGRGFRQVSASQHRTCAVAAADPVALCWGENVFGAVGDGTTDDRLEPTPVAGEHAFGAVRGGVGHTCALDTDGRAWCWGNNGMGQLGDGTTERRRQPVAVTGGRTFRALAAGGQHSCGVAADGTLWCWGENVDGELGLGSRDGFRTEPVAVSGDTRYQAVSAGTSHTCGLTTAGRARCWGLNDFGAVGDGSDTTRTVPTVVAGEHTFRKLTLGMAHTCGLTDDGRALCWGFNSAGQIGDGTTTNRREPTPVAGGHAFVDLSAGSYATCGLTAEAEVWCWGLRIGARPGDASAAQPEPVRVGAEPAEGG